MIRTVTVRVNLPGIYSVDDLQKYYLKAGAEIQITKSIRYLHSLPNQGIAVLPESMQIIVRLQEVVIG